jgi:predicted lipid-binding transport protein (Tim44 family)
VPLLARRIVRAQKQHRSPEASARISQAPSATATAAAAPASGAAADDINLQGYIIGNGVTDDRYDSNSQVDFAWGMGLLDPITYASVQATCHVSGTGPGQWGAWVGGWVGGVVM